MVYEAKDVGKLEIFDHRCHLSIGRVSWSVSVNNLDVRHWVISKSDQVVDEVINFRRLKLLKPVLRLNNHCISGYTIFTDVEVS